MLKIAQCSDQFYPVADGVSRVVHAYARELSTLGQEIYVITPLVTQGYRGKLPYEILDYVTLSVGTGAQTKATAAMLDVHYLSRVNAHTFDIVHAHSPGSAGMEAVRLADKSHAPLVGTFHTKHMREFLFDKKDERQHQLSKHFAFDFFSRCDEIWVVSEEARSFLYERGFEGNIEVFENGTELDEADAETRNHAREAFHLSQYPALLFAGSLDQQNNLVHVFEAAALLRQRDVEFQLLIVGSGPEEKHARALTRELGLLGTVRFLGQIADESLLSGLYAESTLCLLPIQRISAGLVVREAAVQGTPSLVIAGSMPGELITDGVNGLTCGDTPESMADSIAAYLGDPAMQAKMRAQARAMAPVPWDAVIGRVNARYEMLAGMERAQLRRKRGIFRRELDKVDLTLQKRAMDMIWKFLMQDTQHLYPYAHRAQKPEFLPQKEQEPLLRSTPELEGISSIAINALIDSIHADTAAMAHEIMILRNGKVIAEASWAPYDNRLPHQLYSLCKSITATAVGMLVDEGLLDLSERLCDIFYDKVPESETHPAQKMTVRMLLNMSTGTYFNEAGSAMGTDWERDFLHAPTKFAPGSAFDYNSMNTYMLAAIVRRKTGETLTDYLRPRLYEPLGIKSHYWETCPNGTEKGGWGLSLTTESVAKIGQLYLNKGVWKTVFGEKRLLSEAWITEAIKPQIDTPNGEIAYGYGHQIWMIEREGAFLFNGAFGQYMLALPELNAIVVLFSGTSRLFAQGGVLDYVTAAFEGIGDKPLPRNPRGTEALKATLSTLSARNRPPLYLSERKNVPLEELTTKLNGRVYAFDANIGGLMPFILQSVHNNFTTGLRQIVFSRAEGGQLAIEMVEGEYKHRFTLSENSYTAATISQRGDVFEAHFAVQTEVSEAGELSLNIVSHFIETPFTRLIRITLTGEDTLKVVFDEMPSIREASEMLMELTGITRMDIVRNVLPLLKRESLQHTLRTFTTVTVQGRL
jgi:CubicO group peptidase (beta-lactamase class C family)/glycosyltransferase involved in cell wall biosynthesis